MNSDKIQNSLSVYFYIVPILFFSLFTVLTFLEYHALVFYICSISVPVLFIVLMLIYLKKDFDSMKLSLVWGILGMSMLMLSISADGTKINEKFLSVFLNLGTTLISLSVIGIVFQLKDTKEYFANTLSELITQETYISKLNQDQLISLQKKVMEKYFESNGDFNKENSFYHFFNNKIHKFIGMHYREHYSNNVSISKNADTYEVTDIISYNIRAMGGSIQDEIKWVASKKEIKSLSKFVIELRGRIIFEWPKNEMTNEDNADDSVVHNLSSTSCFEDGVEFSLSLKEMSAKNSDIRKMYTDNALVKIKSIYKVADFKSIPVRVLQPTCGFTLRVNHNAGIRCKADPYGMNIDDQTFDYERNDSGFVLTYKDWLLPESGVYVNFDALADGSCTVDEDLRDLNLNAKNQNNTGISQGG